MNRKEYKEVMNFELYGQEHPDLINRIRIKYFQPNTNCMYLARKMWFFYYRGGAYRLISKFIYLRIYYKYGCCIFPKAKVGRGFYITHPVGIVLGDCNIGENCMIFQNCTIGKKRSSDESPIKIGNNVTICTGSSVLGSNVCDNVIIGAMSLVLSDIIESGTYVGVPVHKLKQEGQQERLKFHE